MANTSINLVDLDFASLKGSFKNYLRDQNQFKDYDFEGSNINILLDLLSYNSYKNAFYLNMLLSESFLDSAQLRNSILSHAKELNYLPRSARSSKAKVRIEFEATGESAPYIIQKGSPLTTLVKNESYTFTIPETITVSSANTTYSFETDIFEGTYIQDTYTYRQGIENQRFKLTNRNIDTESLTVSVFEDGNEVSDAYKLSTSLLDLDETSKVFFLQPTETGYFEVLFGDNNLGRRPKINSTIVMEYRTSSGELPNGAREFSVDFDPTGSDELNFTPEVNTLENSRDGAEEESIESIRYMAPRHFQTQERAITASDYSIALKGQFPEINAVHAYGGEDLSPPQFGKVFIAVDITNVDGFPESKKIEYRNFIDRRSPFGIRPVFVDPEFSYLSVRSKVRYDVNVTSASRETLKSIIKNAIVDFNEEYLNDFNVILRNSKLETEIDDSDTSIISSVTRTRIYKKINPRLGLSENFRINFGVPIIDTIPEKEDLHRATDVHALVSSLFIFNSEQVLLEDDGSGNVRIMKTDGFINEKIKNVGKIDYNTGQIEIDGLVVDSFQGSSIKLFVTPVDPDVVASQNSILTIEDDEIIIDLEEVRR
jgi:hypothetical protein